MKPSVDLSTSRRHGGPRSLAPGPCLTAPTRAVVESTIRSAVVHLKFVEEANQGERAEEEADRLLEALAHALRVSSLSNRTLSLAHEVKRPLSVIIQYVRGYLRQLEFGTVDPAVLRENLGYVLRQAELAAGIVDNLSGFTNSRRRKLVKADITQLLSQTVALARAQTGRRQVTFRSIVDAELPAVEVDSIQIQQVALNLIHNAVEAMRGLEPARQQVTVRAGTDSTGSGLEVSVSDLGPGCSRDALRHIFEPFVTTKSDGLGMGLAISRSIVEAHGGRLWVVPNPTDGLSFHFSLPPRKE